LPIAAPATPTRRITAGDNHPCRVLDLVPFEEEDESPFVGLLRVEVA